MCVYVCVYMLNTDTLENKNKGNVFKIEVMVLIPEDRLREL